MTRKKVILRKFPALQKFLEKYGNVRDVSVTKFDANYLDKVGWFDQYRWSGGGYLHCGIYYLIYDDGTFDQVPASGHYASGSGDRNDYTGVRVGEYIYETGRIPKFIGIYDRRDTDANGNGELTHSITIMAGVDRFDFEAYFGKIESRLEAEIEKKLQ